MINQPPAPSSREKSAGLICPNCSGVVPVKEGERIARCPYCAMHSLVQGDRGIGRWQVQRQVERDQARQTIQGFFSGAKKARALKEQAQITEMFLAYLPFWRIEATVAGWRFGRVKSGDETKPAEKEVLKSMYWNDAALDVTEFGVHRVTVFREHLQPFDSQQLHAEAMVFEPAESPTAAEAEAEAYFRYEAQQAASLTFTDYEEIHVLHPHFSLVYYPVWIGRYEYLKRHYQVVVDGVKGSIMYGKAPGNHLYRAAMLVMGLAAGNLLVINGTALMALLLSDSDDGGLAIFLPVLIGLSLIFAGYRAFRYGEEVEDKPRDYRKLSPGGAGGLFGLPMASTKDMMEVVRTGMVVLEELQGAKDKG
jgi:hypothetical protein